MPIAISLATEGPLDEQVLRQLVAQTDRPFAPGVCYGKKGREYLRLNVPRFNMAARQKPFVVLVDLERDRCAPSLLNEWLPDGLHPNLVLRVAVRMVESWLLADRTEFAKFIGVSKDLIPLQPDDLLNAKQRVVQVARRSRNRLTMSDLVPSSGSTGQVGKNYVGRLSEFVQTHWQAERARHNSPSLDRALVALQAFQPSY